MKPEREVKPFGRWHNFMRTADNAEQMADHLVEMLKTMPEDYLRSVVKDFMLMTCRALAHPEKRQALLDMRAGQAWSDPSVDLTDLAVAITFRKACDDAGVDADTAEHEAEAVLQQGSGSEEAARATLESRFRALRKTPDKE